MCGDATKSIVYLQTLASILSDHIINSALTSRDFVPRLELLTLFKDFVGI